MNYSLKKLPKSQLEITVTAEAEELTALLEKAAGLLSQEKPIDGFRPGKAPYDIVKQRFGEFAIYENAARIYIEKTYPKIHEELTTGIYSPAFLPEKSEKQETYEPMGNPKITVTKLAPKEKLEFKVIVSFLPRFVLPDYKKIASRVMKEKKPAAVSEKETEETLKQIQKTRASSITVSRAAKDGDVAEIDFETFDAGLKLTGFESKNHPLKIGEGRFITGFEENIIGMSAGETKAFPLKLPDDFSEKNLAGKIVDFKVTMKSVQEQRLPELTDEFAKGLGNFSGLENLKTSVKEGLTMEKERKEKDRLRIKITDEIAAGISVEIPDILMERELEKMISELRYNIERMGLKIEDYLMNIKKSEEELKKGWLKDAERRIKTAMILREIGRMEKIEPTPEEIQKEADNFIMSSGLGEKEIKKIDKESLLEYAKGAVRNEMVFEFLEHQTN